eukprot:CAMPEP_0115481224 /NCGR_PEP_ID=MMETSP0271-20121206/57683_1 /TAXON_ID=71861 /ORGANISM="Scrippsiella trochoidea, Strain CCMP3099" /LENGTH=78 /DNA_ID=CAMNT_0002908943 /DNA_START=417 /DNA_END=653 /DNA_ORIENTATION=+
MASKFTFGLCTAAADATPSRHECIHGSPQPCALATYWCLRSTLEEQLRLDLDAYTVTGRSHQRILVSEAVQVGKFAAA